MHRSFSSVTTSQPERGRQSMAQRAEFIEHRETVDGRRSGGYGRRRVFHW